MTHYWFSVHVLSFTANTRIPSLVDWHCEFFNVFSTIRAAEKDAWSVTLSLRGFLHSFCDNGQFWSLSIPNALHSISETQCSARRSNVRLYLAVKRRPRRGLLTEKQRSVAVLFVSKASLAHDGDGFENAFYNWLGGWGSFIFVMTLLLFRLVDEHS